MADVGPSPISLASGRRRSRRARPIGRRFQCSYSGCGRLYSRAEHVERHELNHAPKELFLCPVEGCTLSFVRRDLYLRHKTRHEQQAESPNHQFHATPPLSASTSAPDHTRDETTSAIPPQLDTFGVPPETNGIGDTTIPQSQPYNGVSSRFMPAPSHSGDVPDTPRWSYAQQAPVTLPLPAAGNAATNPLAPFGSQTELPNTVLECEPMGPSPSSTEELTAWLFGGQTDVQGQPIFSDLGLNAEPYMDGGFQNFQMDHPVHIQSSTTANNINTNQSDYSTTGRSTSENADLSNGGLTAERWLQLRTLIIEKLMDSGYDSEDELQRDLNTDEEAEDAVSAASMQAYLDAYWKFFHEYLPILHPATFSPETAHSYLVVGVLILGSSMLARQRGSAGPALKSANVIAWNLRGRVLTHADAGPPSRLWVLQTLLLLEVYDKLLGTSALHERALVYYPTTLNLMRRSSTLFGRQVSRVRPGAHRRRAAEGEEGGSTTASRVRPDSEMSVGFFAPRRPSTPPPEIWWEQWIMQEAIRRAAFAAFVLDITHSVMFGHPQTLVFHEIHLYLPCDRILWSSRSAGEVGAVESSLYANGVKPISFLDGLRKMVRCEPCRTNPFGSLILLSGLLSIIGHMQQRDLLTSSLNNNLESDSAPEKWQPKLSKALMWWKKEYDGHLKDLRGAVLDWQKYALTGESRRGWGCDVASGLISYHLGHISIYITMPELGVSTGASTILGRPVSPFEKRTIRDKVKHWAASPGSVDAVYHALELIRFILFPTPLVRGKANDPQQAQGSWETADDGDIAQNYEASYDKLPNRSWALYFATMVLWAYGFNKDGPLEPFPYELGYPPDSTTSYESRNAIHSRCQNSIENVSSQSSVSENDETQPGLSSPPRTLESLRYQDMQVYLKTMTPPSVASPQELGRHLQGLDSGRNRVIGLLGMVDHALSGADWELLDEARQRLRSSAAMLKFEGVN
ncbi:related to C2H2 zinc finger protein [Cephalotrichum gorgonifer]|uniref:Related to C2H2 zinc finger protein n=1 Tax=Cephalotrichum gorgonifer TaxID=2041049 RepID=A0AAE8N7F4_9PEZI|nr:related to C2H2 zinc finger protein [Cephalotrichum gorgonifer]